MGLIKILELHGCILSRIILAGPSGSNSMRIQSAVLLSWRIRGKSLKRYPSRVILWMSKHWQSDKKISHRVSCCVCLMSRQRLLSGSALLDALREGGREGIDLPGDGSLLLPHLSSIIDPGPRDNQSRRPAEHRPPPRAPREPQIQQWLFQCVHLLWKVNADRLGRSLAQPKEAAPDTSDCSSNNLGTLYQDRALVYI